MTDVLEAAQARAQAMGAKDRPGRRASDANGAAPLVRFHSRAQVSEPSDGPIKFEGIASTTEQPYQMFDVFGPYTEVMAAGAFAQTLAANPDVPLTLQHNSLQRIASTKNGTLQLDENEDGLHVMAELDPEDRDVQYIVPKLRSGLIDEMSFAFTIEASEWSPDFTELRIKQVNIDRGDVSIVGFGANPNTSAELRAMSLTRLLRDADVAQLQQIERRARMRLRDLGATPSMSLEELLNI
jgi:HK97 family phage prohead protease